MSRYIRYKYQKQQINFLNCDDLDNWIDTCQTRVVGFDSICSASNCDCTEYKDTEYSPITRTVKLNPNYYYECLDGNRYYKLLVQQSFDNGVTWSDTNTYEIGDLYEANSPFCSAQTVLMDWFVDDTYCDGYDKYEREVKRVSFDNGVTWTDMGYTENGVTTYEYRYNLTEENSCYCNAIGCDNYISFKYSGTSAIYSVNFIGFTATTANSTDNGDGTYTYRTNMRDIGVGEVTRRNSMFVKSVNILEIYEIPYSETDDNLWYMFNGCSGLQSFSGSVLGDTSSVTNMGYMFTNCTSLSSIDFTDVDTSSVTHMNYMFYYCTSLTELDLSSFDTSKVTSMYNMFNGCSSLTSLDLSTFNTSNVTVMESMFEGCSSLTELDLSTFNTSNVNGMGYMFEDCTSLTELNVSGWDVSGVTSYRDMLYGCTSLEKLIIGEVDEYTYNWWCARLTDADISCDIIESSGYCEPKTITTYSNPTVTISDTFNSSCPITKDDITVTVVENVETYNDDCTSSVTSNTVEINYYTITSNPTGCNYSEESRVVTGTIQPTEYITEPITFEYTQNPYSNNVCVVYGEYGRAGTESSYGYTYENNLFRTHNYNSSSTATTVHLIEGVCDITRTSWGVSVFDDRCVCENCTSDACNNTYYRCYTYGIVKLPSTSALTTTYNMFYGLSVSPEYSASTIDAIETMDVSNVENMSFMFNNCKSLTSLDLSNFDTSNVTNMRTMFQGCSDLTELNVSNFDTSNVTDMSYMFNGCKSLTSLDLSNFNTSSVTDMSYMFQGCSGLTELDVSNFDTSSVTNMENLFYKCTILTSLDLSTWDLSSLTSRDYMFSGCTSLGSINLSKSTLPSTTSYLFSGATTVQSIDFTDVDTSSVTDMSYMFYRCSGLTELDLSDFDTSSVTDMSDMFYYCDSLTELDVSNFDTSSVTKMDWMFDNCESLTELDLSNFNTSSVTEMDWMFCGCTSLTELNVSGWDVLQVFHYGAMFSYCRSLTSLILGDVTQEEYDWWYARLVDDGIEDNVTITYNIIN